jgi:hypothetical protein
LVGLAISISAKDGAPADAADFLPWLSSLGIPEPDQINAAIFALGADHFAVHDNFALTLEHLQTSGRLQETRLAIWRRIESPRTWCERLRPDLERCSATYPR